jgi:hypothetical protein
VRSLARGAARRVLDAAAARHRLDDRTSPATKAALRSLFLHYRQLGASGTWLPSIWDTGLRVFSQFDEDGIALFLLGIAGEGPRTVVDLGSGDGVYASNAANLLLNFGYYGLLVDGDEARVAHARSFYAEHPDTHDRPPVTVQAFLTRENVNDVIRDHGFEGEIDLLSIDVDGNDYWLWEALDSISPRFVVIETHPELGRESYVMPYDADFVWKTARPGRYGASPAAAAELAERLGYRLVGANVYGFNVFFARSDVATALPTVSVDRLFELPGAE